MRYEEFINSSYKIGDYYIYGLCEFDNDEGIRYVGSSYNVIKRMKDHLYTSQINKYNKLKKEWLNEILTNGNKPNVIIIEKCNVDNWEEREIYWIDNYRNLGYTLVNIYRGGRKGLLGIKRDNEVIEHMKASMQKYYIDPEFRKSISERNSGHTWNRGNKLKNTSSKYIGVSIENRLKKPFRAAIGFLNKKIHLGNYSTEEEAAIAYNNAALKYFGPDAKLNIIE